MAFLSIGGVTIPAAPGSVSRETIEVGDKSRMFDGTYRETIRGRFFMWRGKTPPIDRATALTVYDKLISSTQPQTVSGDMVSSSGGTVDLFTRATNNDLLMSGSTLAVVLDWELEATS